MVEASTTQSEPFTFTIEAAAKKFDSSEDVIAAAGSEDKFSDLDKSTGIKLSGNSYGFEACKYLSE